MLCRLRNDARNGRGGLAASIHVFIFIFACAKMVGHEFIAHGPNNVIAAQRLGGFHPLRPARAATHRCGKKRA
jgi:hypothetical protein